MTVIPVVFLTLALTVAIGTGLGAASLSAYAGPPFGGPDDAACAGKLWTALTAAHLVGRVAKAMSRGCITCHSVAPGHDFL